MDYSFNIRHVLLVDATPSADLLRDSLTTYQCELTHVKSCVAAQQQLHQRPFDLLITELRLPDGSGFDLVTGSERHQTPWLVVTAFGSIVAAQQAILLGALDYLTKPALADAVLAALHGSDAEASEPPLDLRAARKLYIDMVISNTCSHARAAHTLGVDRRSLRRMLSRESELELV